MVENQCQELEKNRIAEKLKSAFKPFPVSFAYLGGSVAEGTANPMSDIDIFVSIPTYEEYKPIELFSILADIDNEISKRLKTNKVDLKILEKTSVIIQFQVFKKGLLLYEKNELERLDYLENLLNFYYDYKIWYDNFLEQAFTNE